MTVLRIVVFTVVILVLSPFMIVGFVGFAGIMMRCKRMGVSYTAYEPAGARVLFDAAGRRADPEALRLLLALPTTIRIVGILGYGPLIVAARLSGWLPAAFSYPGPRPSNVVSMMAHRTEFLDAAMLEAITSGVTQVVILGAGWDTRAWSIIPDGVRVFEVDAPATSAAKSSAVHRAALPTDRVAFVPVDFNSERWFDRLVAAGFDAGAPAHIHLEGVLYYVEPDAAAATAADVSRLAPGSTLALDYFDPELAAGLGPKQLRRAHKFLDWLGEPWVTGIPADSEGDGIREWFSAAGLDLVRHEPFGAATEPFGGLALAKVPERLTG